MKTILLALITLTTLNSQALAARIDIAKAASLQIMNSPQLQANLKAMGYETTEEAAEAFQSAAEQLEQRGFDTNLGTIAICAKGTATALFTGIGYRICTSISHSYEMSSSLIGLGFDAAVTANLIYFIVQDPTASRHCFTGAKLALGWELYLGLEGLRESVCKADGDYISDTIYMNGALGAIEGGFGLGASAGKAEISLTRIGSYF